MKKQLIIVSFLIGSFSLWGMERALTLQNMSILRMVNKPIFTLDQLDTYVSKYFSSEDLEERIFILKNIKDLFKGKQNQFSRLTAFLELEENMYEVFVNHQDNGRNFFAILYFSYYEEYNIIFNKYLANHPEKICPIIIVCFNDEGYMKQKSYKVFLLSILEKLFDYVQQKIQRIRQKNNILAAINFVGEYIKTFEGEIGKIEFQNVKNLLIQHCQLLEQEALSNPKEIAFDNFNTLAVQYFDKNFNIDKAKNIEFIKDILQIIISGDDLKAIMFEIEELLNKDKAISDEEFNFKAFKMFNAIYEVYLQQHPAEICFVLSYYFKKNKITQEYYCALMMTMLKVLSRYVDQRLAYYPADLEDRKQIIDYIWAISEYIKDFGEKNNINDFDAYKNIMNKVCSVLEKAEIVPQSIIHVPQVQDLKKLDDPEAIPLSIQHLHQKQQVKYVQSAEQTKIAAKVAFQRQQKQQLANTLTVAALASKAQDLQNQQLQELPAEVQSEPTAWQQAMKKMNDWFWWVNDKIESLFRRAVGSFSTKKD